MSRTLHAWILASRPKTLPAAAAPVVVGTASVYGLPGFHWGPVLAALFGALMIQVGTNFANDLMDFRRGADTEARVGPTRVVQAGLLSPQSVRAGIVVTFGLATVAGLYLYSVAGWPVLAIGIASLAAGLAYTGGPYPLGYHGLGDLFVMIFFGFVAVCGTAWVAALTIPPQAWFGALATGSLATALLAVNNLRDIDTDRLAGKNTLAVILGRSGAEMEYGLLLALAFAAPAAMFVTLRNSVWTLLPLILLPEAVLLVLALLQRPGPRGMIRLLERTARLMLMHGGLLAVGLVLDGLARR